MSGTLAPIEVVVVNSAGARGPAGPTGPQGAPGVGFVEAPMDGGSYGRRNAGWAGVLPLAGGTLTGPLVLAADPAVPLGAATRQFVQAQVAAGAFLPIAGGTVTGTTTFSGTGFTLNVPNGSAIVGSSTTAGSLRISGPAGTNRDIQYTIGGLQRWAAGAGTVPEVTGTNQGTEYRIDAYKDDGSYGGNAMIINRQSGPLFRGTPFISNMASYRQINVISIPPGAVLANDQELLIPGDDQPIVPLGANPLATTNGSNVVTVTWINSVGSRQIQSGYDTPAGNDCWVTITGATAVGGVTLSGWYQVMSTVDGDHFTIRVATAATSTATGGGSSAQIQPSFTNQLNKVASTIRTGGSGFPLQTTELLNIDPDFLPTGTTGLFPRYMQRWQWICGPVDTPGSGAQWNLAGIEWDFTNRGVDLGYSPDIYHAGTGPTVLFWCGPTDIPSWGTGGGTATNWNTVYSVYQTNGKYGVYSAFSNQPNALVGAARDPTGHGGVAFDTFGTRHLLWPTSPPFATAVGTSTITVHLQNVNQMGVQVDGNSVYIPGPPQTVNGVTFGGADYVMSSVNSAGGTFQIQGTGTATLTGNGGAGTWVAFANLVPYAPFHYHGSYKHGLISSPNSRVESGAIVETQPGNAFLWTDGTGKATINGIASSTGNIDVVLTPAGTGTIRTAGSLNPGVVPVTALDDSTVTGTAGIALWQVRPFGNNVGINASTMQLGAWQGIGITTTVTPPTASTVPPGLNSIWFHPRQGNAVITGSLQVKATTAGLPTQIQNVQFARSAGDQRIWIPATSFVPSLTSSTPVSGGTNVAVNDRYYDAYYNTYTVSAVDGTGAATTVVMNSSFAWQAAAPSNPIALTAASGAVGTGITVNLTWTPPTRLVLWAQSNPLLLQGDTGITLQSTSGSTTVTGGMSFTNAQGASNTDLSKHIALYSTTYGFSCSPGNRLNHVVPTGGIHALSVGGTDALTVSGTSTQVAGALTVTGTTTHTGNVGFNGTTPVAKPTVSGAKGSNAALASLIAALVSYGLVTDTTTA